MDPRTPITHSDGHTATLPRRDDFERGNEHAQDVAVAAKPRLRPLRTSLLALLAAIFLPLIGVVITLVFFQWQQQRGHGLAQLQEQAQVLRSAIDRELALDAAVLGALGASSDLDRRDWQSFHSVALRTSAVRQGSWIILVDSNGQNLLNTAMPPGSALPNLRESLKYGGTVEWRGRRLPLPDLRIFEEPLRTGRPAYSGLVYGRLRQGPVVATNVPVMRGGQGAYILGMAYTPDHYSTMARAHLPTPDHIATIVDAHGLVVARSRAAENFLGVRAPPPFAEGTGALESEGLGETRNLEGVASYYAFSRSAGTGWVAVVGIPKDILLAPALRTLWLSLGVLALLIAVAAYLLHRLWTRIAIPLTRLAEYASTEQLSAQSVPRSGIREVEALKSALISASDAQQLRRRSELEREQTRQELEAANERLRYADRRKNQFLAMLGHELRNPMAAIGNAIAVLGRQQERDRLQTRMHEIMERQVRHLSRLMDDLLDVARITHGKMVIELQPVRLDLLAGRVVADMRPQIEARRQELEVDIEREIVVSGDAVRLSQVISNLLDNASKYTPESGRIALEVRREGSHALVRVSDNGVGIGPELLQNLFEAFTQGEQSLERAQGGLGLGLAIAREVVQLHGGSIEAKSEGENRGLEIQFKLPLLAVGN